TANASRATSAREIPASAMHRPIKTRRLKKADFEADFFFMEIPFHGVGIALRAAPSEHCSAIRCSVLLSSPAKCQQYSFESMENLSEHRDRANKTDSNELRPTHPIHVWLREIRQRWKLACLSATSRCRITGLCEIGARRCKSRLNRAWLVGSLTA